MTEYEIEPVPGLPGRLPPGEQILWQGRPDRRALARGAFHVRAVAIYFALLTAIAAGLAIDDLSTLGVAALFATGATALCGIAAIAILQALAWAAARSTLYTLTDRRIVLRIGVAVPKCINLPLTLMSNADLRVDADGTGDVPLAFNARHPLGWLALWPHARPWRLARPEPTLRAIPDAARVAELLATACVACQQGGRATAPAISAFAQTASPPAGALAA